MTSDTKAKLRLVNPSLAPDGIFEIIQLGGAPVQTLVIRTVRTTWFRSWSMRTGSGATSKSLATRTRTVCAWRPSWKARTWRYTGSTLGDSLNDAVTLLGHLTNENVTFDHSSDKENTVTLYCRTTQSR